MRPSASFDHSSTMGEAGVGKGKIKDVLTIGLGLGVISVLVPDDGNAVESLAGNIASWTFSFSSSLSGIHINCAGGSVDVWLLGLESILPSSCCGSSDGKRRQSESSEHL